MVANAQGAYAAALAASALVTAVVAASTWRRRSSDGAVALTALLVGVDVWVLTRLTAAVVSDPWTSFTLGRLSYVGILLVPASLLVFVLQYTGRGEVVDGRLLVALAVEPAIVLAVVWLAPLEGLMWTGIEPAGDLSGYQVTWGPLFWVHAAYSYLLVGAATVLLFELLYRSRYLYARQVVAVLVATLAPWVGNAIYLSGLSPDDVTPVSFAATGVALAWGLFGASFMDITPVARSLVVDNIGQAVFVVDEEGRLTDANEAGAAMLGFDEPPLGRRLGDILSVYPDLVAAFEDGTEGRREVVVDTERGRRTFAVEVSPVTDYRERRQGRVFVVRDVTEQRHRERELERQNERLEEFAEVVSHDLRGPLSVFQGRVDLARKTGELEHLDDALDAIERMNQLIDDLLALAHQGQAIDATEPTSIEGVARDGWRSLETGAATLRVVDDATVLADPSRLQQAFENLFRNAVEHGSTSPQQAEDAVEHDSTSPPSQAREDSEAGTASVSRPQADDVLGHGSTSPQQAGDAVEHGDEDVTVRLGTTDDGFYVADDGPGIPADERERIFEHGYTGDGGGTGLGLAIVEAIAEAHGWTVSAGESDAGGARFEFEGVERPQPRTVRP